MNAKNLIGGLLAGAAVGVAIGILLAPSSGKETQAKLMKGTGKLVDGIKGALEDSVDSLKYQFNETVDGAAKKGKEMVSNARDAAKV